MISKLKLRKAKAKVNNGAVVVYYSYNQEEMRFPTGVKLENFKDKNGKYLKWDYKLNCMKLLPSEANNKDRVAVYNAKQQKIEALVKQATDIIVDYFNKDINITVSELTAELSNQQIKKLTISQSSFFDYFDEFVEEKKKHFKVNGSDISIKDYNSTRGLLMDFQMVNKKELRIRDFTNIKLKQLVQFMAEAHPLYIDNYKLTSEGKMKSSTIKKRLDILCEFYNNLKMQKIVTAHDVDVIREFKKKIKRDIVEKETLEIEEIHTLYNFHFEDGSMEKIKDVFVFLCLTGIRYQDLKDFDPRFILKSKENDGLVYRKAASKTGINYQIPLCKIVIEILKKYNYQLPVFSGQYGNRLIKEALKATGMFDNYTQIIDKETNEYKRRYEAVTMHKGRNTFITNLVDCTPLNELMKYTGHKKLSTLQSYIDVKRPVKMEYIKVFDFD